MKKFFFTFMAIVAAASAMVSCNKREQDVKVPEEGFRYTFILDDAETRATLDNGGVLWEAGDRVGMFLDGYTGYANIDVESSPKTVTLYSRSAIPANSYAYAYYPYSSDNDDKTMNKVVISNVQQGGGTSAMPMAGIPFKIEEEVTIPEGSQSTSTSGVIKFLNLGSIINFKVYSDEYSGETVQYVTFQTDGAVVSGDAYIDLTGVDANDDASLALTFMGENEYDYVKVNQEAVVTDAKEDAASIYMVVAPGTYSGTITIGTDVATYTFTFSNKTLARNGLKNYNMNLNNATRVEGVVEVVKTLPYEESFGSNQGDFSIDNVVLPEGISYVWSWGGAAYGMKASAYVDETRYATESWLVSPWIDLTDVDMAALSFDHVHRYAGTAANELTLWAITDDENAEWAQLTIPTWGTGTNWNFVTADDISLYEYVGKKVKIAFKYTSTSTTAATWEVKNFKVEEVVLTTEFTIAAESINVQVGKTKNNPVSVNSGATITYSSEDETIATVDEEGNVTGIAVGETTINVSVPAYNGYPAKQASYEVEVIPAETEMDFTWDLSKASYESATEEAVVWTNDNVTMQNAKGTGTAPNNYIPSTRTSTRFYGGNILTITPEGTCEITKIEFTATSEGYATTFKNSTWTNASAAAEATTVTVTPIDGSNEIKANVGGTCGFTAVKVYYTGGSAVVVTEYTITINSMLNGSVEANTERATQGTEVTLTVTPDEGYELESLSVLTEAGATVAINNNKFVMPAANVSVSASFKEIQAGGPTTYTMTIDSAAGSNGTCDVTWKNAETTSVSYNGITWSTTVEGNPAFQGSNTDCKIGSKNQPATNISISTTGFAGKKIISASLTGYCTSNTGPELTITAGTTTMLPATALVKTTSTTYSSTTNNITLGSSDALTFEINSSASAGIVISKIEVVYE